MVCGGLGLPRDISQLPRANLVAACCNEGYFCSFGGLAADSIHAAEQANVTVCQTTGLNHGLRKAAVQPGSQTLQIMHNMTAGRHD